MALSVVTRLNCASRRPRGKVFVDTISLLFGVYGPPYVADSFWVGYAQVVGAGDYAIVCVICAVYVSPVHLPSYSKSAAEGSSFEHG